MIHEMYIHHMKSRRLTFGITVAASCLALSLAGSCSAAAPYLAELEAYDAEFVRENSPREHLVPRGDHVLAAREYGREHRGGAPSLVLMHGFPDSMHLYDLLVPRLATERHVITFDFLGWGDSDKPRDHEYDFRSLDEDVDAVLRYFALESVVLVTHDISGPAGVDRTLSDPTVESLVLLNTVVFATPKVVRPEAIETFSDSGLTRDFLVWGASTFDRIWIGRHQAQLSRFLERDDEEAVQLRRVLGGQSFEIRHAFFDLNSHLRVEMAQRREKIDVYRALDKPVVLVFGVADPYLNVETAKELEEVFPRAELVLIQDAGHFLQIDQPDKVAQSILAFTEHEKR